ncbi:hypothetical protein [Alsobacter sp. R-9]
MMQALRAAGAAADGDEMPARTGATTRWGAAIAAALGALALAGCQQGLMEGQAVSAAGVPVAVETIEGAPPALQAKVNAEVASQASARRIELVSSEQQPRYRLKGYLTAYSTGDGETALAIVWDVFDASKKRAQRVSTTTLAKGEADDPWSRIGETQISKATAQSMNEVAAFLAGSPSVGGTGLTGPRTAGTSAMGFTPDE